MAEAKARASHKERAASETEEGPLEGRAAEPLSLRDRHVGGRGDPDARCYGLRKAWGSEMRTVNADSSFRK